MFDFAGILRTRCEDICAAGPSATCTVRHEGIAPHVVKHTTRCTKAKRINKHVSKANAVTTPLVTEFETIVMTQMRV